MQAHVRILHAYSYAYSKNSSFSKKYSFHDPDLFTKDKYGISNLPTHTGIQLKLQDIFTANQKMNFATLFSICEINCNVCQFSVSTKNQFANLQQRISAERGAFGLT